MSTSLINSIVSAIKKEKDGNVKFREMIQKAFESFTKNGINARKADKLASLVLDYNSPNEFWAKTEFSILQVANASNKISDLCNRTHDSIASDYHDFFYPISSQPMKVVDEENGHLIEGHLLYLGIYTCVYFNEDSQLIEMTQSLRVHDTYEGGFLPASIRLSGHSKYEVVIQDEHGYITSMTGELLEEAIELIGTKNKATLTPDVAMLIQEIEYNRIVDALGVSPRLKPTLLNSYTNLFSGVIAYNELK